MIRRWLMAIVAFSAPVLGFEDIAQSSANQAGRGVDLAPRLFVPECSLRPRGCGGPTRQLMEEGLDAEWSALTERKLRELWSASTGHRTDVALYVVCKSSVCQVNYRTPPAMDRKRAHEPMIAFRKAFYRSELRGKIQEAGFLSQDNVVTQNYKRIF